ncbi:ribosomal protection-like ABC-F family protein [Campylobacter canadensis]|uniref:ABC-F family ATP-binding cassette domain-containing protein n=1 Tax=Campylobacter canadensis TaxID=449520 RepID=A0ABS7WPD5_9BACT|nr:ABC-F family ATP-binding cassette domain-containing protein [Campylobacter canadensis]MBZ7986627.1 ABC-F family ATP-binding cassette domain-containing protein [Campylobacter canadensis]MBZ7993968.1 ABC-F family ATP-binding cassette domain-containing protein [Campylobacter canadensis]MBZ7996284.1 ABC-F family ATP-binding cassette domain-containing protein [Campylobacter canadensis]MBZ7997663.1 ABC-F family ATP-binding cassette domain-containing protein [Campylobacter canadensis]MBZ7999300.1 
MLLVDLIDISKNYGEKVILKNVNFSLNSGEKVAIIGKNGAGKSTFLKILTKQIEADSGRIIVSSNLKIEILSQSVEISDVNSVDEYIKKELSYIFDTINAYNEMNIKLQKDTTNTFLLNEIARLSNEIDSLEAWSIDNKIKKITKELELDDLINQNIHSLSGGELRRLSLACLLLKNPDILILDEPTNHLDVNMCRFIENMLKNSKKSVLFISHDRYFIDSVANKCIEIEDASIKEFKGGYTQYLEQKADILASLNKSYETLIKQLKAEEEWLRRGVKARLKRNEGRKERIFKMREEAKKNPSLINRLKTELSSAMQLKTNSLILNKKKMLFEINDLSLKLGNKKLFDNFTTRIIQGQRIAIVGKNGCGKSSFLQLLLGKLQASNGFIKKGDFQIGYFDQKKSELDDDKTLIEYFCPNGGDRVNVRGNNMHVYGYLKKFLFPKEQLSYKIGSLSGGEKSRIALAKLFTKEYEVLILDEPTNDLDIATINILEQHLSEFNGALIFVSHDRYFTDRLATMLFAFYDEKINIETMSFSELLDVLDEIKEINEEIKDESIVKEQKTRTKSKKLSYKQNEILNNHPDKIAELEKQIKILNSYLSDKEKYEKYGIVELSKELDEAKNKLDKLEEEYYEVLQLQEEIQNDVS